MVPTVALIGFMGSGKSEIGAQLARILGWDFVDLDEYITGATGTSIPELFATRGEEGFRELELRSLEALLRKRKNSSQGCVLALGGGTVTIPQARSLVADCCLTIWLRVSPDVAWERVSSSNRPLARDRADFLALAEAREHCYERAADWTLATDELAPHAIASRIAWIVRMATKEEAGSPSWSLTVSVLSKRSLIDGGPGFYHTVLEQLSTEASAGVKAAILTDDGIERAWKGFVRELSGHRAVEGRLLVLPAGEATKSPETLVRCWSWLSDLRLRRDDVVAVLGGGVIGDVGGLTAATYARGVRLWQVPTTVVSQVDSSVGGKVAVNLPAGKNLVGTFYQPDRVFVDPAFLLTLPPAELTNGLGEVLKYGLLMSREMLEWLESVKDRLLAVDPVVWSDVARRCIEYKAAVVERDERDMGERAVLNLGHTTAHALERVFGYSGIRHGEAVGVGLLVALRVSEVLLGCPAEVRERTRGLLTDWGLPVSAREVRPDEVLEAMNWDKKQGVEGLRFVGLADIGKPVLGLRVPERVLRRALEEVTLDC